MESCNNNYGNPKKPNDSDSSNTPTIVIDVRLTCYSITASFTKDKLEGNLRSVYSDTRESLTVPALSVLAPLALENDKEVIEICYSFVPTTPTFLLRSPQTQYIIESTNISRTNPSACRDVSG